jgi:excisionase family DNA binding protein
MQEDTLLNSKDVKEALQISDATLRRWVKNGKLKSYQMVMRGKLYFKHSEINEFLTSNT